MPRRPLFLVVPLLVLSACGGGPGDGGSEESEESAQFCELGFRIGDTSVLQDVDLTSPATHEASYTEVTQTMKDLIPLAPESAKATIEAGHETLVGFSGELDAVGWDLTQLSPALQISYINLGDELIEVSPAIREAC